MKVKPRLQTLFRRICFKAKKKLILAADKFIVKIKIRSLLFLWLFYASEIIGSLPPPPLSAVINQPFIALLSLKSLFVGILIKILLLLFLIDKNIIVVVFN